jgi:hypothetical protein
MGSEAEGKQYEHGLVELRTNVVSCLNALMFEFANASFRYLTFID